MAKSNGSDANFVLGGELPSGPDNDIIGNGLSSGMPMYDLSDSANQQTWTPGDTSLARPGIAVDSDNRKLIQTRQDNLLMVRGANPFVPIYMLPNSVHAVVLVANVAKDIPVPAGAKYFVLNWTTPYWLSRNGNASVPAADILDGGAAMFSPNNVAYYCEEMQAISVVAPADCIVSAQFYFQQ